MMARPRPPEAVVDAARATGSPEALLLVTVTWTPVGRTLSLIHI